MFSKPKTKPAAPQKAASEVPIPPLPDLPSPGQAKSAAPAAAGPAVTPSSSRGASSIASDLVFEGNVSGAGELVVDGQIKGDIRVNRLTVGETGSVEGSVQADTVEVRGRVVGSVTGKQVRLMSTAYVDGDINHEQLAIEVGAYFQGRCLQTRPGQAAPAAAPAQAAPAAAQPATPPASGETAARLVELKTGA